MAPIGYVSEPFTYPGGGVAAGILVSVMHPDSLVKAPIFHDTIGTRAPNPLRTDVNGRVDFYAEPGSYDLRANGVSQAITVDGTPETDDLAPAWPINLTNYGVRASNDPTLNRILIQAAVEAAEESGRPLLFPWTSSWILIDDSIYVRNGGITITGQGTRIRLTAFPKPVFEITGDDVTMQGGFVLDGGTWSAAGAPSSVILRGETWQGFSCGVWVGGNRVHVDGIRATNFISAVRTSNWDVVADVEGPNLTDCSVRNVTCSDVAFGLLVRGSDRFSFSGIKGSYKLMPGSGLPPHLLYVTGAGSVEAPIYSSDMEGYDCAAYNGEYSYAYQIKYVKGSNFAGLKARACMGSLHIMNSYDVIVDGLNVSGDTSADINAGSVDLEDINERILIVNAKVEMAANGKPVRLGTLVTDSVIQDSAFISRHTSAGPAGNDYDIDIRGARNVVDNCSVNALGSWVWGVGIGIWAGTGHLIIKPRAFGHRIGATIRQTALGEIRDYAETDVVLTTSGVAGQTPARKVDLGATGSIGYPRVPASALTEKDRLLAYDLCDHAGGSAFAGIAAGGETASVISATTSGHAWTAERGAWWATNNATGIGKRIFNQTLTDSVFSLDVGANNVDFRAGHRYGNRGGLLLCISGTTPNFTYLLFRLNHTNNLTELYKRVAGAYTLLQSAAFTPTVGRRYRLRFTKYGSEVRCFIDGVQLLSHTLDGTDTTTFGTQTKHGLAGQGSTADLFDNLEWYRMD